MRRPKLKQLLEPRGRESGTVMVLVLAGLVALIGFTALGIDVGLVYNARTQAQAAADASALAAALNMISAGGVTLASGTSEVIGVASQNAAYPNPSLVLAPGDVTYGGFDWDTRTLDTSVDLTNSSNVTGVKTVIRLEDGLNDISSLLTTLNSANTSSESVLTGSSSSLRRTLLLPSSASF